MPLVTDTVPKYEIDTYMSNQSMCQLILHYGGQNNTTQVVYIRILGYHNMKDAVHYLKDKRRPNWHVMLY